MKLQDVLYIIQKRLARKIKAAEAAFISQRQIKKTTLCLNHGSSLGDRIYHCKINAMGEHELGASQCWDEKARLCPYFEKQETDKLRDDFRSMSVRELSLRWPSIGELLKIEDLLKQVEIHEKINDEKDPEKSPTPVLPGDDNQALPEDEGLGRSRASL